MNTLERLMIFGKPVTIEVPKINHETATGILVEYNSVNAWLPKNRVQIEQKENSVLLTVPRRLYKQKF